MTGPILHPQARAVTLADGTRALVIDSIVPDAAPPEVREGLARRAIVNGGGTCPCGARMTVPNRAARRRAQRLAEVVSTEVEHEAGCPAITEVLVPRILAWRRGASRW